MFENRIVSRRQITGWLAVWLGLLIFALALGLVMSNQPAHAASVKHVINKRESWSTTRYWVAPNNVGTGTHIESVTERITTEYIFWPDGSDVNKIAPVWFQVCYTLGDQGTLFQGVNGNTYYQDDTNSINPGSIIVDDDGTSSDCKSYGIPDSYRRWLRMDQSPEWQAHGKVRLRYAQDDDFDFKWFGSKVRYFHPSDDLDSTDWYECSTCNYPGATS